MARAAVPLVLVLILRGAFGAVTVAADPAPHGRQGRHSAVAPHHGTAELHSDDSEPSGEDEDQHGVHSAHQGEGAELHRTAGHMHHATAADLPHQEKHASAAHEEGAPKVVERGAKGLKSGEDADEASPQAEPEEDAEELEAAEDDEGFEGPEEGPLPQRSRTHEFAVDAAGDATEEEQGGRVVMRRHNHTSGAEPGEGYLEEGSLVEEDADLEEQARRSGWWSRRRAPPRRRRAPPPVIHCAWASWGKWTTCSATCGQGKQSCTRGYARMAKNGGIPCSGEKSKTQTCQIKKCTTTSTTTTSTTTTTTTTTTKKPLVKAGAPPSVGGGALALLALALSLPLL